MKTHLRIALTAVTLFFSLSTVLAQEFQFQVIGNKENARLAPGDTAHLFLSASASGAGTLKIKIDDKQRPAFVSTWNDTSVECQRGCKLEAVLAITPMATDCGEYEFAIIASFEGRTKSVPISGSIYPRLFPEPPYTPGDQNEVCWAGCQPHRDHLVVEPDTPTNLLRLPANALLNLSEPSCETVPRLVDGIRYKYTVVSRIENPDGSLVEHKTEPEYSTQDNTPPTQVVVSGFSVDEQGWVTLRWQNSSDTISPLDAYRILRFEEGKDATFREIEVVPFQAVRIVTPLNYVVKENFKAGDALYLDSLVTATRVPDSIDGAYMIRPVMRDRWNESADFLQFRIGVESDIYIAYDNRRLLNGKFPDWLREPHFSPTNKSLESESTKERLRLHESAAPLPGGTLVTLGGNFSEGTRLETDTPMYIVFVVPREETPEETSGEITFADDLLTQNPDLDQHTFRYRIDAIDVAGNEARGAVSSPVIVDFKGRCRPEFKMWSVPETQPRRFGRGTTNTVELKDPGLNAECDGFRATDFVRFQAVRDAARFFDPDLRQPADSGLVFFDSGWLAVNGPDDLTYAFNFGVSADSVDGRTFFYRAQSKDIYGNESAWSDTVDAIQDALPPGDIRNLSVAPVVSPDCKTATVDVCWDAASDRDGSGVAKYQVFRRFEDEPDFAPIGEVLAMETCFRDTPALDSSKVAFYKVGSVDSLDFVHEITQSKWDESARVPIGPIVQPDATTGELVVCGNVTGTNRDTVTIRIDGNRDGVLKYFLTVNGHRTTIRDISRRRFPVALTGGDGLYKITAQAEYESGPSTCSDTLNVVRKATPPDSVQNLVARHDPNPTGNIILEWDPLPPDSLSDIIIIKACDGDSATDSLRVAPEQTSAVFDSLVGYQCCNFTVRVRDCFGNFADAGVSQYSDLPPKILCAKVDTTVNGEITICWQRPWPRVPGADEFRPTVEVYTEFVSEATRLQTEEVFDRDGDGKTDSCFTFVGAQSHTNYVFRVREKLLAAPTDQHCAAEFESNWSDTCTVPYKNLPASVTTLQKQALPVHPDSTTGSVYLTWPDYDGNVDTFLVMYGPTDGDDADTLVVSGVDTALVRGLNPSREHWLTVSALDRHRQQSVHNDTVTADFNPQWKFTPMVSEFAPGCFRDSATVLWQWKNIPDPTTTCGAESVQISLSIDPQFHPDSPQSTTEWLRVTGEFDTTAGGPIVGGRKFMHDASYPFVSNSNNKLFAQIRAKDRWGHVSPWSRVFSELGVGAGVYDAIPPEPVTCEITEIIQSPTEDLAAVKLSWGDADSDNCSGTWYYEIVRTLSGQPDTVFYDTSRVSVHTLRDTVQASLLTEFAWMVHPVDSLMNRQPEAAGCAPPELLPPQLICVDDTTVCWSTVTLPAGSEEGIVAYYAQAAASCDNIDTEGITFCAWVTDTCCVYEPRLLDSLCWRVRARVTTESDTIMSDWSKTFVCELNRNTTPVQPDNRVLVPEVFSLSQNYPNPFNPTTRIQFGVPANSAGAIHVRIEIFNLAGQLVRTLVDETMTPGIHHREWDALDVNNRKMGSGVYVYRMTAGSFVHSKKMILLK